MKNIVSATIINFYISVGHVLEIGTFLGLVHIWDNSLFLFLSRKYVYYNKGRTTGSCYYTLVIVYSWELQIFMLVIIFDVMQKGKIFLIWFKETIFFYFLFLGSYCCVGLVYLNLIILFIINNINYCFGSHMGMVDCFDIHPRLYAWLIS